MDPKLYRTTQLRSLTNEIGVYALCDLDEVPVYVGQSVDGIRVILEIVYCALEPGLSVASNMDEF